MREHHWAPSEVGALFFDAEDIHGLDFWYNDVKNVNDEIKNPKGEEEIEE